MFLLTYIRFRWVYYAYIIIMLITEIIGMLVIGIPNYFNNGAFLDTENLNISHFTFQSLCSVIFIALYTLTRLSRHPLADDDYLNWLKNTPWKAGSKLPLGSFYPQPIDLLFFIIPTLAFLRINIRIESFLGILIGCVCLYVLVYSVTSIVHIFIRYNINYASTCINHLNILIFLFAIGAISLGSDHPILFSPTYIIIVSALMLSLFILVTIGHSKTESLYPWQKLEHRDILFRNNLFRRKDTDLYCWPSWHLISLPQRVYQEYSQNEKISYMFFITSVSILPALILANLSVGVAFENPVPKSFLNFMIIGLILILIYIIGSVFIFQYYGKSSLPTILSLFPKYWFYSKDSWVGLKISKILFLNFMLMIPIHLIVENVADGILAIVILTFYSLITVSLNTYIILYLEKDIQKYFLTCSKGPSPVYPKKVMSANQLEEI